MGADTSVIKKKTRKNPMTQEDKKKTGKHKNMLKS